MIIAYIVPEDLSKHPGLSYKIESQIRLWRKAGCVVYKILLGEGKVLDNNDSIISNISISKDNHYLNISLFNKLLMFKDISKKYKFAVNALMSIKPDLTYSRYLFPAFNCIDIFKYAGKFIFEINSDDRLEYYNSSRVTGLFNSLFRKSILKKADGFIFVTNELESSNSFRKYIDNNSAVIANGTDVKGFDFFLKAENKKPNLVFIGSPGQSWHGLDKIKTLSNIASNAIIHIVGPDELECKKSWGYIPDNIYVHGYLQKSKVDFLLKKMDIGIGSLALHRKGMDEACPLKVRQYLSYGIPVIAAYKDTDLSSIEPFYLILPNAEDNILNNSNEIARYINYAFNNMELRLKARDFASERLSFDKKESIRLNFFKKIIDS